MEEYRMSLTQRWRRFRYGVKEFCRQPRHYVAKGYRWVKRRALRKWISWSRDEAVAILLEHIGEIIERNRIESKGRNRASLIRDGYKDELKHIWISDRNGVRILEPAKWSDLGEEWTWARSYTCYFFKISEDLMSAEIGLYVGFLSGWGYSLLIVKDKGQLKLVDDPDGSVWIS